MELTSTQETGCLWMESRKLLRRNVMTEKHEKRELLLCDSENGNSL
jgi:hypothetical protein